MNSDKIDRDRGPWIQTYSGRKFHPFDPKPEEICIEDIAHSLSQINRFTGHTVCRYSVAQHSLLVAYLLRNESAYCQLLGLLHDSAEAYIGDIPSPFKKTMCFEDRDPETGRIVHHPSIHLIEDTILNYIGEALQVEIFDSPEAESALVKSADLMALAWEKRDLLNPGPERGQELPEPPPEHIFSVVRPRFPDRRYGEASIIKETFIKRFKYLLNEVYAQA